MTDVVRSGPRHARVDSDEWERIITTGELRLPNPPWDDAPPRKDCEQLGRLRWWWWVRTAKAASSRRATPSPNGMAGGWRTGLRCGC